MRPSYPTCPIRYQLAKTDEAAPLLARTSLPDLGPAPSGALSCVSSLLVPRELFHSLHFLSTPERPLPLNAFPPLTRSQLGHCAAHPVDSYVASSILPSLAPALSLQSFPTVTRPLLGSSFLSSGRLAPLSWALNLPDSIPKSLVFEVEAKRLILTKNLKNWALRALRRSSSI